MRYSVSAAASALVLFLIAGYRRVISPLLPSACRYYPSCSEYAARAVETHGPVLGTALAARRLCRCHPWREGGFDPVPPSPSASRSSALAWKETR